MTKEIKHHEVDLSESSIYGEDADNDSSALADAGDVATETALDRLEAITGGADEPEIYGKKLELKLDAFDASTQEEIDALNVNLLQDDNLPNSHKGSGRVIDDVAEERIAEFTEVGRDLDLEGVLSAVPGRDDTSEVLRRHHPVTPADRTEAVVEGNLDDPVNEDLSDSKVDQGTGA